MSRRDITDEQVVLACADHVPGEERSSADILEERTGQPYKVCLAAMTRAHDRGLINYGGTLARAFPTENGYALIGRDPPPSPFT